jgi:hypothetical protein
MVRDAIFDLEALNAPVKVDKGGHTVDQVIQRLYGVSKQLDTSGLGKLTYGELRRAEALGLSIAVLTVLWEAKRLGAKI